MSDLNRREDSPIMQAKRKWERALSEEQLKFAPDSETIERCKYNIKSLDEMLDRLELKG